MIRGADIRFPTSAGAAALDGSIRLIRMHWPLAVFEDALTAKRYRKYADLPFRDLREVFVYRDSRSADSWNEFGADPSNAILMVHLLLSSNAITVVVDDPTDPDMKRILQAISAGLRMEVLNAAVQMRGTGMDESGNR